MIDKINIEKDHIEFGKIKHNHVKEQNGST